jgi:predicted molibdopterin-dependent oxidoreductase YjgC
MSPRLLPWKEDPIRPTESEEVTLTLDGISVSGVIGQSIAGVILASGTVGFRRTSIAGAPRGVFCGIGVCFDCLVEVNGLRDVRACQRRASNGDVVVTQYDPLPVAISASADSAHPDSAHFDSACGDGAES